jgi:hypothetical protein
MAAQRPHQAVQSASGRRRRNALRQEYEIGVRMLAPQRLQWPINKLMGSAGEGQPGSRSAASKDCPAQPLWRGFCVKAAYTELAPDRFCVKSPEAGQISLSNAAPDTGYGESMLRQSAIVRSSVLIAGSTPRPEWQVQLEVRTRNGSEREVIGERTKEPNGTLRDTVIPYRYAKIRYHLPRMRRWLPAHRIGVAAWDQG